MRYPLTHKIFRKRNHSETPKGPAPHGFFPWREFFCGTYSCLPKFSRLTNGHRQKFSETPETFRKTKRASWQFFSCVMLWDKKVFEIIFVTPPLLFSKSFAPDRWAVPTLCSSQLDYYCSQLSLNITQQCLDELKLFLIQYLGLCKASAVQLFFTLINGNTYMYLYFISFTFYVFTCYQSFADQIS